MNIRSAGAAKYFQAEGEGKGQTDMSKLKVAFHNSTNALNKTYSFESRCL